MQTRHRCAVRVLPGLNDNGLGLMTRMMSLAAAPSNVPLTRLEPGTSLEL